MPSHIHSAEQRSHIRYRLKKQIYIDVQGIHFDNPASVADINRSGVGFYSISNEKKLADKFIVLDLMYDSEHFILRSLTARVAFICEATPHKKETEETLRRYGLKFINLSPLQKRQIDLLTKKYALPDNKNRSPT